MRKSTYEMILERAHEVVQAAGLFEEFEHSKRFLLCIVNEPYMPLVVGSWPTPEALKGEQRRVLIAHYYRHTNRTYPDPALEMTDVGFPIRLLQTVFGVMESRVLWLWGNFRDS